MLQLLLLFLPLAAISGWFFGYRQGKTEKTEDPENNFISPDYFLGLNYLINEQPDKAVDVFIRMLEVNTDTVETHLALGNLFRRRGEVDRAIRIHQNLIARPQLAYAQRIQALFELAQDYLRAGVLDRAEKLFLELIEKGGDVSSSLNCLINIYQQQKDWGQAISTAKKLESLSGVNMNTPIAHYYCELANKARANKLYDKAYDYLKDALRSDKNCARANIILGQFFFESEKYQDAIDAMLKVYKQDPEYVSEVINLLAKSYKNMGQEEDFVGYLKERISDKPRIYYILAMTDYLLTRKGEKEALDYLLKETPRCLSLRGLERMLGLYVNNADSQMKEQLQLFKKFIDKLLENKPVYRCITCGFSGKCLYWQCPSCRRWNSVKPIHGLEGD